MMLTDKQKEILTTYLNGNTYKETAQIHDIKISTAHEHVKTAKNRIEEINEFVESEQDLKELFDLVSNNESLDLQDQETKETLKKTIN